MTESPSVHSQRPEAPTTCCRQRHKSSSSLSVSRLSSVSSLNINIYWKSTKIWFYFFVLVHYPVGEGPKRKGEATGSWGKERRCGWTKGEAGCDGWRKVPGVLCAMLNSSWYTELTEITDRVIENEEQKVISWKINIDQSSPELTASI